jgi:ABC-type branched-subunit amino acid transport system substrate-binding protein/ABC-type nitrate/sulfonate/bicarbonate transport system substrate-binding protein
MSKRLIWLLTLLVTLALVAGCTGAATPAPEQPAEEEPAAEAPAATEEPAAEAPAATEEPAAEVPAATEEPAAEAPAAEGCTDAIGCVEIAAGDPIHIAWIATVSGGTAPLGTDNNRGVEIAIDDKGGELLGHPIELTGEDSLCSAEGGQTAGTKIASDPTVVGIIGTTCSSEARAAMPLIAEAGMVMISPSNTNPDLTNPEHPDHHPGYLRTAHNDLFQGRVAAEFAYNELGLKTAATIHDGSPYAESLQAVFAEVFTELGGTITSQEAINVGDTDMKGVLTKIGADKPDIIYFPIFEPEGDFIAAQKCDVADLADTVMMGADGLTIDTFPEAAGECAIGMYLSGPFVQGQAYDDFVAKYEEKYGEKPVSGFHAHAYDGTNMLFNAIEQVAVQNDDGSLSIGRQALRDAMYGIKDFQGLTGTLSCDENGDCATGEALAIFQLTEAEVVDGAWPPKPFWLPGGGEAAAPAAEGGEAMEAMAPPECTELTPVSLQLQWVAQSQFAGYYAAKAQGFFEEFCLDVTILEGAVDIVPQQVVASGQAQFGIAWVPKVLASREEGADLVNIAQVFQRSGTLEVSWADAPVATVADMKGKKIGTWGFGNEHELFAAMRGEGIDPNNPEDVEIIQQSFDMLALLNRELDAAQAMTYNEYAQVLEAENPETGELYQPEDLVVINFNDVGTAMLQDHVFVDGAWLAEEGNEQLAIQFLAAAFKGWQFCRDSFDECVQIVLDNGPTLGQGHMTWQLNEINKLIWPSPNGIGIMDPALWEQTATISVEGGVIKEAPSADAYRTDLAEAAHKFLSGDVTGESWTALEVEVTPGGE